MQLTAEAVGTGVTVDAVAGGVELGVGDVVIDGDPRAAGDEPADLESFGDVGRLHRGYHRAITLSLNRDGQ